MPGSGKVISTVRSVIRAVLADELVEPLLPGRAGARLVHVDAARGARRLPVQADPERDAGPGLSRAHDEVHVAGVEPAGDVAAGRVQRGRLLGQGPVPGQRPLVEQQPGRGGIAVRLAGYRAARGDQVLGALVAEVVLR